MDSAHYPDYRDPMKFSVPDNTNSEWRGVRDRTVIVLSHLEVLRLFVEVTLPE